MIENYPNILPSVVTLLALSMLPFFVVMATSFTKIVIVLMLLRNALGVQQAPSGLVVNSIALTLTAFILFPVGVDISQQLRDQNPDLNSWDSLVKSVQVIAESIKGYLIKMSFEREIKFFIDAAQSLWPPSLHIYAAPESIFILLPAHITSEITRAFEISFLLFLPFVIIDLLVSNILLAMGAMMVPPMLLSLPAKLLLFVAADGWTRLLHGLILSYA